MANNYKIKIDMKIVKSEEEVQERPNKQGTGQYEYIISGERGRSIDEVERAILVTNAEALRDGIASHLTEVSKAVVIEAGGTIEDSEVKHYRVDGEVGRFTFAVHHEKGEESRLYPILKGQEWYRTEGFKEIAYVYGTVEDSYRQAGQLINRVRHQAGATPVRTLHDSSEREGQEVQQHLAEKAKEILAEKGFDPEGHPNAVTKQALPQRKELLPAEQVAEAIKGLEVEPEIATEVVNNPVPYENPTQSANVSIDDVSVKRQTEERNQPSAEPQQRKYLHQTVAHIQHGSKTYLLNGFGVVAVLRLVLAFLLHNELLDYNLIVFFDGHKSLGRAIVRAFAWFKPLQLILDWYHLKKKCKELLSLACKGRQVRNDLLAQLMPLLWHGCVDGAIALLQATDLSTIKNKKALDDLIDYLEYHRASIPCYAVRKKLGLRNGSNPGEKANDLLVSDRQKDNGMSWSRLGSVALASLTALVKNNEYKTWFSSQTIAFTFAA
jgi:flavin-binding protein dodecin